MHELLITTVRNDSAVIVIKSNVTAFSLKINEEKDVDVDGDGKKDIRVKLLKIEDNKPLLELKTISALGEEKKKPVPGEYLRYIYAGIAVLVVLILIFVFRRQISGLFEEDEKEEIEKKVSSRRKKFEDEFEDSDEDLKELKIGRYVIALIVLVIIYFAFRKFNLIAKLDPYRYFILGGLIVLLIIVILVKYWDSIADFFEEEEETPRKGNNRRKRK